MPVKKVLGPPVVMSYYIFCNHTLSTVLKTTSFYISHPCAIAHRETKVASVYLNLQLCRDQSLELQTAKLQC